MVARDVKGPPPGLMIWMSGLMACNTLDDITFGHWWHAVGSLILSVTCVAWARGATKRAVEA